MSSEPRVSTPPTGQTHSEHQSTQPASTLQAPGSSSSAPLEKRTTKPQQNKRPTHFVCFPLVTDESVSQLSKSLAYFRSITTPLPSGDGEVTPERDAEQEINAKPTARAQSSGQVRGRDVDHALRIIPDPAHRPPGTFHLTLGVMHLPNAEDLENATAVLQKIDYLELLRRAESGGGDDAQKSTRGRRNKRGPKGGMSEDADEVTPNKKETQSEGQEKPGSLAAEEAQPSSMEPSKAENPPATTEDAYTSKNSQNDTKSVPSIGEGQHGFQELKQTRNPRPSTDTSNREPEDQGKLQEATKEVGAILSSPLQTLKSLAREISPPRGSVPSISPQDSSGKPDLPQPITVSLSSLGTFPSARSARVFYAHPHDPTARLHRFGNLVRDVFREAGLITETRPLVLHATVANLVYVKGKGGKGRGRGGGGKWKRKGKAGDDGNVDAREILGLFNHGGHAGGVAASSSPPPSAHLEADKSNHTNGDQEPTQATISTTTTSEPIAGGSEGLKTQAPNQAGSPAPNPLDLKGPETDQGPQAPFIWARDISIRSIRICKMGAEPSALPGWGLEYRPIAEKVFMP